MNPKRLIILPPEPPYLKTLKAVSGDLSKAYSEMYRNTMAEKEDFESDTRSKINIIISSSKTNSEILNDLEILQFNLVIMKGKVEYSFDLSVIDKLIKEVIIPQKELYAGLIRMNRPNPNYVIKTEIQEEVQINNESELNPLQTHVNSDLKDDKTDEDKITITKIIPNGLSLEQITNLFKRLYYNNNPINGKPFMLMKDIDLLLKINFEGFSDEKVPASYISLNIIHGKQTKLFYSFIYHFYQRNERHFNGAKMSYALFIKNNFEYFKDHDLTNLYKNIKADKTLAKNMPWAF